MRLLKLTVRNFQALASAEVEFGPGLNVLFGPNDLGKSTLATAIRAALLVPTGSAAARPFLPWHSGSSPEVSLSLSDDQNHYWKIRKSFGESSGEAELFHSKDGITFALDCRGRQVEERVRGLLDWGIPPPGGKGAPRGMPASFLAKALLAEQTEVDDILSASVAEDSDESGKLRLLNLPALKDEGSRG